MDFPLKVPSVALPTWHFPRDLFFQAGILGPKAVSPQLTT
jgi:hypothetical protein